ncbi:MAG TPA: hypothetical protein VJL29_09065 [Thermoguttaceae bacterium]|nr:hypothetical protein [Thermoguttaceae bacterium]
MPITISCSKCRRKYQVSDKMAGRVGKCQCGESIPVLSAGAEVSVPSQPVPTANLIVPTMSPATPVSAKSLQPVQPGRLDPLVDPFAGLSDEMMSDGSSLQPLAPRAKRPSKKKGPNLLLIGSVAGGAVLFLLIVIAIVVSLPGGESQPVTTVAPPANVSPPPASPKIIRWATPEAVFEAQKKAIAARDWKAIYETCSPSSQPKLVAESAAFVALMAQRIPEFEVIRKEYGIGVMTLEPSMFRGGNMVEVQKKLMAQVESSAEQVADKPGFFARVMETTMSDKTADPTGMLLARAREAIDAKAEAELSDVKVSGDRATATRTLSVLGVLRALPIDFVKVDGEWFIDEKPENDAAL